MQTLTIEEFIDTRKEVARRLGENSSAQWPARERQAEKLMKLGYIDFDAVSATLHPAPGLDDAEEASA